MKPERAPPRIAPNALAAAVLLGLLAFLFIKTEPGGFERRYEALRRLAELRDLDARWDRDAELARIEAPSSLPPIDRDAQASRVLRELRAAASALGSEVLTQTLPTLEKGLLEKSAALAELRRRHALTVAVAQTQGPQSPAAAEALRAEQQSYARFNSENVGLRLNGVAQRLADEISEALAVQERYRAYLFAYSAALLILAGFLASRVLVGREQLRAANEDLEQRVVVRTQALSDALDRLKESEAQLVQTEKMSSLGQMIAGVAHEINTPLAYVKSSLTTSKERLPQVLDALVLSDRLLHLLRAESPAPAELDEAFGALSARLGQLRGQQVMEDLEAMGRDGLHGVEQISDLVTNLRNFARLDRSRVASYNVNEGVLATLLLARTQLRNIDIEKHLGDVPSITCSPSQVNQVLLNLVTNAVQAMDKPNARLVVTTRSFGADSILVEIADNGTGITPEVLPRIFDPFFTTKEIGKGTGLGLSIAYKIVAQHGGRIEVRSEPGKGSTFGVVLPVIAPQQAEGEAAERLARDAMGVPA